MDIVKDSWLFDDHFKSITGPLIVTILLWSIRSIRRLFFPFFWIFKNNLSSGYLKLSADDKIHALKIIKEYKETEGKCDILMKELKLKQYGLYYPLPILTVLFDYFYDNNMRTNNTGFLSFLDCYQIFDYDRKTMPIRSFKKITIHALAYIVFLLFSAYYIFEIYKILVLLFNEPMGFIDILTAILMFIIGLSIFRLVYIILENSISFFWAVHFSIKLRGYFFLSETNKLIDKYKP